MKIPHVTSADGTRIAFESAGKGPPLILVGGAFCDRKARASGTPLAALLAPHFTVFSYDRRGRGDSADTPDWAIEREVEDLAALIREAGGSAFEYGISSGALLGLTAAVRQLAIPKLALYEPPLLLDASRAKQFDDLAEQLQGHAAAGRRSEAAELFLTRVVQVPAPAVAQMKQAPLWRGLESLAHTLSYDVRITALGPALLDRAPLVRAATLALCGTACPPWMHDAIRALSEAIPAGSQRVLEGQTHDVDPQVLTGALLEFFSA
ncbi:MAG: alpha/beta hydrolase [Polyangiaceae bacterium]